MAKPVISPEEFIAEVNEQLSGHQAYRDGMRVFLVPKGASGKTASGYDFEPNDTATAGVVASVARRVEDAFEVDPFISRVRNG